MARRSVVSGSRAIVTAAARGNVQVEGLAEIQKNIALVLDGVSGKQAKDVYMAAGIILRDTARAKAPYDPGRTKGTHLRDAIFAARGDETKPNVLVGVRYKSPGGAPHAHLIEYGTVKMSAQPFMRPAIVIAGTAIASTIQKGLLKIIEEAPKL